MFLFAPSNSVDAVKSLFEETATITLLVSDAAPAIVDKILKAIPMPQVTVPELRELLDEELVEAIPFSKTFDEYRMQPWIILHTSGSTGTPKPIVLRHGYPTVIDAGEPNPSATTHVTYTTDSGSKSDHLAHLWRIIPPPLAAMHVRVMLISISSRTIGSFFITCRTDIVNVLSFTFSEANRRGERAKRGYTVHFHSSIWQGSCGISRPVSILIVLWCIQALHP